MNQEKASYIVKYFPRLMSMEERTAWWHHFAMAKIEQVPTGLESREAEEWQRSKIDFYREQNLITQDASALALLDDGYDNFILKTAERIMKDEPGEVFFNDCPNCGELARTPHSKQCRHCGHSWHHQVGAAFRHKLSRNHSAKPNHVVFEGEVEKGEINTGMLVDLTYFGINLKPEIDSVTTLGTRRVNFDFLIESSEIRNLLIEAGKNIEPINIEFSRD